MDNATHSHVLHLQEAMKQNRLVVFVGAGASASVGVPTWPSLIQSFKTELPERLPDENNVYHLFPVLASPHPSPEGKGVSALRDRLHDYLADKGIGTVIHYPIAPHKQECYKDAEWNRSSPQGGDGGRLVLPITEMIADCELSLPISPCMTQEQVEWVVKCVNTFSYG